MEIYEEVVENYLRVGQSLKSLVVVKLIEKLKGDAERAARRLAKRYSGSIPVARRDAPVLPAADKLVGAISEARRQSAPVVAVEVHSSDVPTERVPSRTAAEAVVGVVIPDLPAPKVVELLNPSYPAILSDGVDHLEFS